MNVIQRSDPSGWKVRWNQTLAERNSASGLWRNRTMADLAENIRKSDPQRVLLVDNERDFTVDQVVGEARRLALALIARGLKLGDRVSYQLPNWREAIVIDLACTMAGLVVHPLIPIYRGAEVSFMMEDCGSRMILVPAEFRNFDYRDMLRTQVLPRLSTRAEVVVLRGDAQEFTPYESLLSGPEDGALPKVDPNAVKLVLYTSGTTGRPKGVLHTHNTVETGGIQAVEYMNLKAADSCLVASPVTHISGAQQAFMFPWILGVRAVLMDTWNADKAVELMERHHVSSMNGATPFLRELLMAAQARGTRLPEMTVYVCGGASVPADLMRQAYDWFENCAIVRAHGCTEVPTTSIGVPRRDHADINMRSDGRPVHSQVKLVDAASGGALPWNEEGEILMRGPQMMLGYLRAEDNETAFDEENYFRSGDLARYVKDNWIVISGRKKDLIIRSGENLSAREIEDAIMEHPVVTDCAAVSMPNERTGEAVCAFVVVKAGKTIDLPEIHRFMVERGMAKQKIPEKVVLVPDLPKTASGKVQKHVLRDQAKKLVS